MNLASGLDHMGVSGIIFLQVSQHVVFQKSRPTFRHFDWTVHDHRKVHGYALFGQSGKIGIAVWGRLIVFAA